MKQQYKVVQSGTYLIPSLLTIFNLTCGILAILLSIETFPGKITSAHSNHSRYLISAWLILSAMIFDYLDGKVARWIHAVSDFGIKIDSLTDFVSFGIAPMVIVYSALLKQVPFWLQSLPCLFFMFSGAWRLARFNCETENQKIPSQNIFTGLPIPAAAALVCTLILVLLSNDKEIAKPFLVFSFNSLPPNIVSWLIVFIICGLALLMISRIPFAAFKKINRRNLILLGGVAIFCGVLSLVLPIGNIVFLIMLFYLIIGLFQYFLNRILHLYQQDQHSKPLFRDK